MKFALVLITYNHERFIEEALQSILSQTRVPDEVVIADDASKDSTPALIRAFVERHGLQGRWTVLLSETNQGINGNLQNAINHTTADVIVPLAGDDLALPNRVAASERAFLANPEFNIVADSGYVIDEQGAPVRDYTLQAGVVDDIRKALRIGSPLLMPVGQSWRRRMFDRFGPLPLDVPNEDDQVTFWGLMTGGILCTAEHTFKYRLHGASASSWLRTGQSNRAYVDRYLRDTRVRHAHMLHWRRALLGSDRADRDELARAADLRAAAYGALEQIEALPFHRRIGKLVGLWRGTSLKERVYLFFGTAGVVGWRKLRVWTGRA